MLKRNWKGDFETSVTRRLYKNELVFGNLEQILEQLLEDAANHLTTSLHKKQSLCNFSKGAKFRNTMEKFKQLVSRPSRDYRGGLNKTFALIVFGNNATSNLY